MIYHKIIHLAKRIIRKALILMEAEIYEYNYTLISFFLNKNYYFF